jgi:hypothetical protein
MLFLPLVDYKNIKEENRILISWIIIGVFGVILFIELTVFGFEIVKGLVDLAKKYYFKYKNRVRVAKDEHICTNNEKLTKKLSTGGGVILST